MTWAAVTRRVSVCIAAWSLCSTSAFAQDISLDVFAGRIVYEPLSSNIDSTNTSATLRVDMPSGAWLYGTGAVPFSSSDQRWGAIGGGGRFARPVSSAHRVNIGADLLASGFLFRDPILDQSGHGGVMEAIPFVQVPAGAATLEVRGGWRGQMLSYAERTDRHHVLETGIRATYGAVAQLQADARWVHSDGVLYPFYGGRLVYNGTPLQVWLGAGKWFDAALDDVSWSAGAGVRVARRLTVWGSVQQDATDPLYWNLSRRSWSVGLTHVFGGSRGPLQVASSSNDPDGVLIRLDAADVDGASVSVAGDFNGWRPVPMVLEGREWQLRMPLTPGVYHYAFRSERGQWFVPESVPSRRSDGMGGVVAVLVVN